MDTCCPTCGTMDFINQDGHYYCYECGTQSQERRDEIVDDEELTRNDFSNFQQIEKRGAKRKLNELLADDNDDQCCITYQQCWQNIFQSLLKELVTLGYHTSIEKSGKLLWFIYLNNIFKKQLNSFNNVDTFDKQITLRQQQRINKRKTMSSFTRRRSLSRRIIISLLYIASIFADQFIPLHELLSLMQSDKLSLPDYITQTKSRSMLGVLHAYYSETTVFYSLSYYGQIDAFKDIIRIPQNKFPINLVKVGNNLLQKLLLPDSLQPLLQRLLYIYHDINMNLHYYDHTYNGTVCVKIMAIIIVLMKLIYRLDDNYEHQQSNIAVSIDQSQIDRNNSVYSWRDWVTMATVHHYTSIQSPVYPTYRDIYDIKNLTTYINHCINVSFKHHTTPINGRSLIRLEDKLNDSYSSYLLNKRARRRHHTTTINNIENTTNNTTKWLFQTLQDKVILIDSAKPIPPLSWFPLTLSISHLGGCGCNDYHPLPLCLTRENSETMFTRVGVSTSQIFLLKFAANIIHVPVKILISRVIHVEQTIRPQSFLSLMTYNIFNKATDNKK